jgi:hypothetical protein
MSDTPRRAKGGGWAVLAVAFLGTVGLYMLSVGPAAWLLNHGWIERSTFYMVYAPLLWAAQNSDIAAELWLRYVWWWRGGLPGPSS